MKSLLSKNLRQFLIYTTVILLCCAPIFFFIMKFFYTKDLDELIVYRSNEFVEEKMSAFTISEIDIWNKYNEDIQILLYNETYSLDKPVEEYLYNKAEGHHIDYRIVYKKVQVENKPYILMCRIPMIENHDLFWNLFTQYGLIFIILLISLGIVQRIISKKSWKPFYKSLEQIENYSLEQGIIPEFEKTNIKEFFRLNEILTNLISNNLKAYKQQKEFIENASHELQTPLAVFQSQLDILMQEPDLTEKQVGIIQSLYSVSSRLTRLNKNLLLLAKIDNAQFKDMQEIDFAEFLDKPLQYFQYLAEDNGITMTINIQKSLVITANQTLLESLINNLIVNAIRHNIDKEGIVNMTVQDNTLTISNTGEAKALDPEKVFKRFNRISEEKKGNGLGLSIIYQICKFHKWELEYQYRENLHIFIVRF
ncbi:signal transduction histidine kinase [Dysgonomonas hofstadii]|uniref:histidine kinase n=1 Tax=Dysgonomonas hofstadii TaxID=637886 RepID=A0A840CRA8_9BACT|nr:HAMP domain-containing sensor histidine kinase [Dysgonomonas hofstadii]MBB4035465.1 signal transduction histidine kinase [Dysgonomonas hofstadii]